ncbi:hypothetical protein L596_000754 [Steinernema carpocapsae]|uniref:Uncharacterized protein n=1 Tax=Steinernema carpocapsae TaxID=34508 RepID=A0A4U8UKC5_STECR|nr:hypothetical protein L596_000754 [Steinernema carpocapsae]
MYYSQNSIRSEARNWQCASIYKLVSIKLMDRIINLNLYAKQFRSLGFKQAISEAQISCTAKNTFALFGNR